MNRSTRRLSWADRLRPFRALAVGRLTVALLAASGTTIGSDASPALAAVTTEPVEPGVVRITGDGYRELIPADADRNLELSIGLDGSVWLLRADALLEVGQPETYPREGLLAEEATVRIGSDGLPWVLADWTLWKPDGQSWAIAQRPARGGIGAFDIAADGTVWSSWFSNTRQPPYGGVGRQTVDGWTDAPLGDDLTDALTHGTPGEAGDLQLLDMEAGSNGSVWTLWQASTFDDRLAPVLLRFDGRRWTEVEPFGPDANVTIVELDAGDDGSLWLTGEEILDFDTAVASRFLARLAAGEWTVFPVNEGLSTDSELGFAGASIAAGRDGSVWIANPAIAGRRGGLSRPCDGAWSFDGSTWRHHLEGRCVMDLDVAPDGRVWAVEGTYHEDDDRYGASAILVIDPASASTDPRVSDHRALRRYH